MSVETSTNKIAQCVNCGKETNSKFCPLCGQKQNISRLNFREFVEDFLSRVYGLDGMFPRTIIDLTLRPGKVIGEYIRGNRVRYIPPVGYYFLTFALFILVVNILSIDLTPTMENTIYGINDQEVSELKKEQINELVTKINNNIQFMSFILFPFIGFWSYLIFRKGYTIIETMVFVIYANAHPLMIGILLLPLIPLSFGIYAGVSMLLNVAFFIWCALVFYYQRFSLIGVIKSLIVFMLGFMSFTLMIAIFTAFSQS